MSKKKKLKPGQLCTIVDKSTGDRYVVQAKRYRGSAYSICVKCQYDNHTFLMLCPMHRLNTLYLNLFDKDVYPKIIKYVKNS